MKNDVYDSLFYDYESSSISDYENDDYDTEDDLFFNDVLFTTDSHDKPDIMNNLIDLFPDDSFNIYETVDKIVAGEKITFTFDLARNTKIRIKMFDLLKDKQDNANCMYYAALCLPRKKRGEYLKRAGELGNVDALFLESYSDHSIEKGLEAITKGFRSGNNKIRDIKGFYSKTLEHYVEQQQTEIENLREKNKKLEQELTEERLRPPESGGSEYEKAKMNFHKLIKS